MAYRLSGKQSTTRWGRRVTIATTIAVAAATFGNAPAASAEPLLPLIPLLQHTVGTIWGDDQADASAEDASGKNSPAKDAGSLYTIEKAIGARAVWAMRDAAQRPITGQGVGVAVLDSGVSAVAGLDGSGKLVAGPDLSIEANGTLTNVDTFGHGTHMAGIIGARDAGADLTGSIDKLNPSTQLGVAPDATIEALKLGTTDGSTDVSQVIAALNWVTEHQTLPNGQRIRVVNLSYGTDSVQPYQADPLAAAAENAWRHGLVVVVSAGNDGNDHGRLNDPAMDPYVLSVGASDSSNSVLGWASPGVAEFSNGGTWARHADVLAPGRSIVSLRAPGSSVDVNHPEGRVDGDASGRLFRGSGTSQAAAVVSGAAALLLQAVPTMTPDEVKAALMTSATPVAASPLLAGAGQINIKAALAAARLAALTKSLTGLSYKQSWPISTGQGSIESARGGNNLVDAGGDVLSGEVDVQGNRWDPAAWWSAASTLSSWQGGSWNGAVWTGSGWDLSAGGYLGARWSGARWSGARWSDADWDAARWSGARWSGARWSAARWSDADWSGARWSDAQWK